MVRKNNAQSRKPSGPSSGTRSTPKDFASGQPKAQDSNKEMFDRYVLGSYARFDIVLDRGRGSYVWDVDGKRYLDLGGGIAVNVLGHAHPEVTAALNEQSQKLVHVSNLYFNELQGQLAARLVDLIGPGRVFFANSGAEANEGLFKLARRVGDGSGRFEIITATESFHGRTLAGIAATGQEKVKKGFGPAVAGFKHVPFNDLEAARAAVTDATAAILIEPVQGESGVTVATPEYLLGLKKLCDDVGLLLLFDEVQAGHFRTGAFHSWQTILNLAGRVGVPPAASGVTPDASRTGATFTRRRRLPHFEFPWAIYGVTISTVDKRVLSPRARTIVLNAATHFHSCRYELFAACVMPDRVHILFQPSVKEQNAAGQAVFWSLGELMHSIKSFTAKEINKVEGTNGVVWEQERFDRFVRGDRDLEEKFRYIIGNPWKAGVVSANERYQWIWTREDAAAETAAAAGGTPTLPRTRSHHREDAAGTFLPDGISMAKALGGGFPIAAFWVREKFASALSAGSHASTFGGTPLACAVALRVLDVIERENLATNAAALGSFILKRLRTLARQHAEIIKEVRGLGLMIGIEFQPKIKAPDLVKRLHEHGVLAVPAATSVVRLLPALNLTRKEAEEGLGAITDVVAALNG